MHKITCQRLSAPLRYPMWVGLSVLILGSLAGCSDGVLSVNGEYAAQQQLPTPTNTGEGIPDLGTGNPTVSVGDKSISITTPSAGEYFGSKNVMVTGTATGVTSVTINGLPVPVANNAFSYNVTLGEGPQNITASTEGLPNAVVPVLVDLTPPALDITSPPRGNFLVEGQNGL